MADDLVIRTVQTYRRTDDGTPTGNPLLEFKVRFAYLEAPDVIRQQMFSNHGLQTITPAQLAYLQMINLLENGKLIARQLLVKSSTGDSLVDNNPFLNDSWTRVDVIERKYGLGGEPDIIVFPEGPLSERYSVGITRAHDKTHPFFIPKDDIPYVNGLIKSALQEKSAIGISPGDKTILATAFSTLLTEKVFTDELLGTTAQEYCTWLLAQEKLKNSVTANFNTADTISQRRDYLLWRETLMLNSLRLGITHGLTITCDNFLGYGRGAFGVEFIPEGHAPKIVSPRGSGSLDVVVENK